MSDPRPAANWYAKQRNYAVDLSVYSTNPARKGDASLSWMAAETLADRALPKGSVAIGSTEVGSPTLPHLVPSPTWAAVMGMGVDSEGRGLPVVLNSGCIQYVSSY